MSSNNKIIIYKSLRKNMRKRELEKTKIRTYFGKEKESKTGRILTSLKWGNKAGMKHEN